MRPDNPASGFRRRIETERERFLTLDEIARLAKALTIAKDQRAAGIIRLCMLTGARLGEVRQARFEQFNLELAFWSKPATTTKQRRAHRLPISADVAALVRQRRVVVPKTSPWLFPGDVEGEPVQEIRRFWIGIQKSAELPGVRINDLRHTDVPYRRRNWTPDGPRYKALGNSMAVNVMGWLGERIETVEHILRPTGSE